ncbi:MAG TPA: FAD-dependent oxidoreductase [Candidatus Poseidoniales archaeon]|nr:FAD-dependent oxidoreductase [Candidatus Poseidoniales archaeon]
MTSLHLAHHMRRIGVVGDGLAGLSAALVAAQRGAEVVVFGTEEPLGGLSGPISAQEHEWLFDQIPISWRRKGRLDRLLRRMKVPMPSREIELGRLAIVRDDQRIGLPSFQGWLRRPTGPLAFAWPELIRSARRGDISEVQGPAREAATLLNLMRESNPQPDPKAVLELAWRGRPRVPLDGWVGVSGRLISACLQTDVDFQTDGPVTGLRMNRDGRVDGVRRKGRVLPVDAVVLACPLRAKRRILEGEDLPASSGRTAHLRCLGLSGALMRPHVGLWDADREVFALDLAQIAPERVPREHRGAASLLHCIAFGDEESAAKRIEAFLDAQCSGWRTAIETDHSLPRLRMPALDQEELPFDRFSDSGIFFAGEGVSKLDPAADGVVEGGIRAGRAAAQS